MVLLGLGDITFSILEAVLEPIYPCHMFAPSNDSTCSVSRLRACHTLRSSERLSATLILDPGRTNPSPNPSPKLMPVEFSTSWTVVWSSGEGRPVEWARIWGQNIV